MYHIHSLASFAVSLAIAVPHSSCSAENEASIRPGPSDGSVHPRFVYKDRSEYLVLSIKRAWEKLPIELRHRAQNLPIQKEDLLCSSHENRELTEKGSLLDEIAEWASNEEIWPTVEELADELVNSKSVHRRSEKQMVVENAFLVGLLSKVCVHEMVRSKQDVDGANYCQWLQRAMRLARLLACADSFDIASPFMSAMTAINKVVWEHWRGGCLPNSCRSVYLDEWLKIDRSISVSIMLLNAEVERFDEIRNIVVNEQCTSAKAEMYEESMTAYFVAMSRWMKAGIVRNADADTLSAQSGRALSSQPELELPDGIIDSIARFNSVLAISRATGVQLVVGELPMEMRRTLENMEAVKAIDHRVQTIDPFGGRPLRMRVDANGQCTVWSIGPDGVDGHGDVGCWTGPFKSINASGDLVVGDRSCR